MPRIRPAFSLITVFVLLLLLSSVSAAQPDRAALESTLLAKLGNKSIQLRVARAGNTLRYSETGDSKNEVGIRGLDDGLLTKGFSLKKDELRITAERLQAYYDFDQKR